LYQEDKPKKTRIGLTKEVLNDHLVKFNALIMRWVMFYDEPVIAPLQCQVVIQALIKCHTLVLEINVQGFSKAFSRTRALLSKPEGMFKTDKDG